MLEDQELSKDSLMAELPAALMVWVSLFCDLSRFEAAPLMRGSLRRSRSHLNSF